MARWHPPENHKKTKDDERSPGSRILKELTNGRNQPSPANHGLKKPSSRRNLALTLFLKGSSRRKIEKAVPPRAKEHFETNGGISPSRNMPRESPKDESQTPPLGPFPPGVKNPAPSILTPFDQAPACFPIWNSARCPEPFDFSSKPPADGLFWIRRRSGVPFGLRPPVPALFASPRGFV